MVQQLALGLVCPAVLVVVGQNKIRVLLLVDRVMYLQQVLCKVMLVVMATPLPEEARVLVGAVVVGEELVKLVVREVKTLVVQVV